MGVYVVTGCASGMGRATADELRWRGHRVIGVDLKNAEVEADLSTKEGRQKAVEEIHAKAEGRLEGAVFAAGLGPIPGRERLIASVNFCGTVEVLEGIHPLLAAAGNAKVVAFSSNSTTTVPGIPEDLTKTFRERDIEKVLEMAAEAGPERASAIVYAASKAALSHWVRSTAVSPKWAGNGVRVNAIAPGAILTPMVEKQLQVNRDAILDFPVPIGGFGNPADIADWVVFMLSPAANFLCGTVIFLDGGTDAYLRSNDYPQPLPASGVPEYMKRMAEFKEYRRQRDGEA